MLDLPRETVRARQGVMVITGCLGGLPHRHRTVGPHPWGMRAEVSLSVDAGHQDDLVTPGRNPACACARIRTRESPNFRR